MARKASSGRREDARVPDTRVTAALDAPAVAPTLYSETYYLDVCAGSEVWKASGGTEAAGVYAGALRLAGMRRGDRVLDVGTGRGETLAVAVDAGARWVVGVDYSRDALGLARRTIEAHGISDRAIAAVGDARALPLPDCSVDLALMLDIVEHLTPPELAATLREVHRVLAPDGRLFVHTMPTRTIYEVTYRLQRWALPWRLRTWPRDPRKEYEHLMHVNEQTARRLRRALCTAGFASVRVWFGEWVYTDHVPRAGARRTYARLARWRLTRPLGIANLFAEARHADHEGAAGP